MYGRNIEFIVNASEAHVQCALDYMSSRSYFEFCLICFLSTHKCYCTYEQKTKCMHQLEGKGDLDNFPIIRTDTLGLEDWREEA